MVFRPGIDRVPVSGPLYDEDDRAAAVAVAAELFAPGDKHIRKFERALAEYFGVRDAVFVNSGSSANLLALTALELPNGSEVITTACAFPSTVNPIIQNGLVPVFVDVDETFNIDVTQLEAALSPKTRAVMVAHTLGNPFNVLALSAFAEKHSLIVIEDCCDAAGATYAGEKCGGLGGVSTLSFYPAHQLSCGGGGAVLVDNPKLAKVIRSYRDWGRDCWCAPGVDNTCGKRFAGEYDHKYTYSRIGYNLKGTDVQAAVGLSQLKKINIFVASRHINWKILETGLADKFKIQKEQQTGSPSWFGFAFAVDDRQRMAKYLDEHKIDCRPLFAGNLLRHPAYLNIEMRTVGKLPMTDFVHDHVLWVGCHPALTREMLDYTIEVMRSFYAL